VSDPDIPTRGPAKPVPYVIAGILIAIAIIMPLIVPLYAFAKPTFWGMPVVYWYQLLWVFIAAGLLAIAYLIMRKEDRRRREEVRGLRGATDAEGTTAGDHEGDAR
jgi:membrane protein implicated in regulation of membrane protease activity